MGKNFLIVAVVVGVVVLFVAAGLYAATEVKDVIPMNNKAYKKHEESIYDFKHKLHMTEYTENFPELYQLGCGECHHEQTEDRKIVLLKDLKLGDEVKNCIECHKIAAFIDTKTRKKKKLKKKDVINDYHANAVHKQCSSCHRKFNKKMKLKSKDKRYAPTKAKCKACHPKKKK